MKLKFLIPNLFVALLLLNSCSKEDVLTSDIENSNKSIEKVVFDVPGGRSISTSGTMLSFSTIADYYNTIDLLIEEVESHEEAFFNQYLNLNGDELDNIINVLSFNEHQPLIDFENNLEFNNSKRKQQKTLEIA